MEYPSKHLLEHWVEILRKESTVIKISLPAIDEEWYEQMMRIVNRVQYAPQIYSVHETGAQIFYNVIKSHEYLVDGNKRSSIVVVYLFYILNDMYILPSIQIHDLAIEVARSHGRSRHDYWIKKIGARFSQNIIPMPT